MVVQEQTQECLVQQLKFQLNGSPVPATGSWFAGGGGRNANSGYSAGGTGGSGGAGGKDADSWMEL